MLYKLSSLFSILLFIFLFPPVINEIYAQNNCQVSGNIKDDQGNAIGFAVVGICQPKDSSIVKAMVSDDSGTFVFTDLKPGTYYVQANLIGYNDAFAPSFTLSSVAPKKEIYIQMKVSSFMTEDIVIQGQKPKITQEAGVIIVDVENNVMNSGQSAAEALSRVPGVSVDKDGQLKLKGRDGVMVMIDDKPLYLDAAQVGALLKSLPAYQLKQIELMTTPDSKFDAAGTAGIINIKLKKGGYQGWDGTINNSYGRGLYPKATTGINLSYRKNKVTLNGGYQYNYRENLHRFFIFRNYITPVSSDSLFNTSTNAVQPEHVHTVSLGGSYKIHAKGTLSWDANTFFKRSWWNGISNSLIRSSEGVDLSGFQTVNRSRENGYNALISLGYKHQFDTLGTELAFLADYKSLQRTSYENQTTYYSEENTPDYYYRATVPIGLDQASIKMDFTRTVFKNLKIETGYKYNKIITESKMTNTLEQDNHFIYDENIHSVYFQFQKPLGKWKIQSGIRMEQTSNSGEQKSIDSTFRRNYANLFPSANLSYQFSEKTSYALLYSRRIERPFYESLNPFIYYSDPFSRFAGNPFLLPQYTDHFELTWSGWKGVLLTTLNYSYTSRPLADVFILDKNSLVTTYTKANLTSIVNTGISFSFNLPITKWWSTTNFLHFYNNSQSGNVGYGEVELNLFSWSYNATNTFKLPAKFSAELSGVYESRSFWGTIYYNSLWQVSLGVSRKILKEKFTMKVSATDLFWTYHYQGNGTFGNTRTKDGFKWDNRVLTFSLTYHLRRKPIPKA